MENDKIKQYLLGNLAENETREMDLRVISDASFEEDLLAAEEDLMDDYLDGLLSPPDAKLFRENFLVSDERCAALRDLNLLKNYARARAGKQLEEKTPAVSAIGRLDKLKSIFVLNWNFPAKALGAFLFLCAALGVGWSLFFYDSRNNDPAQREIVRLNAEDLSDLARFESFQTVSLAAGAFRNSGAAPRLTADRIENGALFRLVLPAKIERTAIFDVRLSGKNRDVLTLQKIRLYENQNGQELRLIFPATILGKGDYRIEVTGDALAAPAVYSFTVQ